MRESIIDSAIVSVKQTMGHNDSREILNTYRSELAGNVAVKETKVTRKERQTIFSYNRTQVKSLYIKKFPDDKDSEHEDSATFEK